MKKVSNRKYFQAYASGDSVIRKICRKYGLILFAGVFAMAANSCQKAHDHIKTTVPLNAVFQDTGTLLVQGSPGVPEQVRVNGWGYGTPIGKSTFEDMVKVNVSVSPEIISGLDVITSENGDKIISTFDGYSPDPDKEGNYEVFNKDSITGGTGQYAGATGNFTVLVKGNLNNPIENTTYTGTITY